MSDHDALLKQFISMTSTDPDFAKSFLEASNWDFEAALNLYLDGGGAAAASNVKIASQPPGPSGSNDPLAGRIRNIQATQGVDYATAKAIAEAEGSETKQYEDGVRAPIAATTGRLIDQQQNGFAVTASGGSTFRDFEAETRAMEARLVMGKEGIGTSAAIYNGKPQENQAKSRAQNLQDLFSPPREILFQGTFDQARAEGQKAKKWILVNIQKDSVFLSYVFNRDLWSQDVIKDTIRNGFIFFQHEESDSEANRYITFYKPTSFPHISIVDPLTGERMVVIDLSRFQNDPTDLRANFLEQLNTFLDNNKLDPPVLKPTDPKRLKKDPTPVVKQPTTTQSKAPVPTKVVEEEVLVPAEPFENDPDATLVQIRLFDGKRLRRRFKKQDKVGDIFAYVKSEIPEARSRKFDLSAMKKSLLAHKDSTLIEQKLINTLMVARWI